MAETKAATGSVSKPEDQTSTVAADGASVDATQPPAAPAVVAAAATPAAKPKAKRYVVIGAAVVLPVEGGSEKYLYRGASVGDGFTDAGIKHALAVGLIAQAK